MVKGLGLFRDRFAGFEDRYVLIGGAAIDLAMDAAGIAFRVTKDLDIVLRLEALDAEFGRAFWGFVGEGDYKYRQRGTDKPTLYRFREPANDDFPYMIELFWREPDLIEPTRDHRSTRIPMAEEVSSLSAILLADEYYGLVQAGARVVDGLSVLAPAYLVPLKARAWIDLTKRREGGEQISRGDIKKHRNDVIRLSQLISPEERVELPDAVRADLVDFVGRALHEGSEPKTFGVVGMTLEDVRSLLGAVYGLS